ncbi:MAG: hypothetical protein AB4352_28915 [Hormoscilla sp.]
MGAIANLSAGLGGLKMAIALCLGETAALLPVVEQQNLPQLLQHSYSSISSLVTIYLIEGRIPQTHCAIAASDRPRWPPILPGHPPRDSFTHPVSAKFCFIPRSVVQDMSYNSRSQAQAKS